MDHKPVLVVADDAAVRSVIQELLQQILGVRTASAGDEIEALEKVKALQPALVIVDIMLPELDGIDVVKALKADPDTASIPVIATTALDGECRAAMKAGCADCVQVPFHIDSLAKTVQKYLPAERARTAA